MTAVTGRSPSCSLASCRQARAQASLVSGSTMTQPVFPSMKEMFEMS